MILELLRALGFIFVAEMGDKTQILAMAFATKYKMKHVLIGIAIGAFLNHALAIALGSILNTFIDLSILGIIAGFLFVIFALWTLQFNGDEEVSTISKYGPIITVALAFFIGELGDKTQLTAFALATEANYPFFILLGTVSGMIITGLLGIFIGIKLGSKIPEFYIKVGASVVFFVFGVTKLQNSLPTSFTTPVWYIPFALVILLIATYQIQKGYTLYKAGDTLYSKTAERLYNYYNDIEKRLEEICLGANICGKCSDIGCLVGYTKRIIKGAASGKTIDEVDRMDLRNKEFDKNKVIDSLKLTVEFLKEDPNNETYISIHQARKNFEQILLGKTIEDFSSYQVYLQELEKRDKSLLKKIV